MTFRKELTTLDRLFYNNDINVDTLLYILSKRGAILQLPEIGECENIDNVKKEKILVTIAELCDKGYAKERDDNKSVKITNKGRWRRIYTNPTYVFWGIVLAALAIILTILLNKRIQ